MISLKVKNHISETSEDIDTIEQAICRGKMKIFLGMRTRDYMAFISGVTLCQMLTSPKVTFKFRFWGYFIVLFFFNSFEGTRVF